MNRRMDDLEGRQNMIDHPILTRKHALVVGALGKWMFASEYGVINHVLAALKIIHAPVHWLSDTAVALLSVTLANTWYGMPFSMILIAAALTSIPQEHYEAAQLDGAGATARVRYITFPA